MDVPKRVAVAGTAGRQTEIKLALRRHGVKPVATDSLVFTLVTEPSNPHDRDAVKVLCGKLHVGYLPKGGGDWVREAIGGRRGKITVDGHFLAYDGGNIGVVLPKAR